MTSKKYLTHRNGRGKLFDQAEVCDLSFIDQKSEVHDTAEIYNSKLTNCIVRGNAFIANAELEDCYVEGKTRIVDSTVIASSLYDTATIVNRANVLGSTLQGSTKIYNTVRVEHSALRDVSVYGDTYLKEIVLDGLYRIGTGFWTRSPLYHRFHELEISLTESTNDFVYIGCERKPMKAWIRHGPRLCRHFGWPLAYVEKVTEIFENWMRFREVEGNV